MEVLLIVGLFVSSALSLNFLVGGRSKLAGAMNIVNLCLTVAVAYQFDQVKNIICVGSYCGGCLFCFEILHRQKTKKQKYCRC